MTLLNDDFLLGNDTAKTLFHDYAEKMPIIDFHCHLNPEEISSIVKSSATLRIYS